MKPLLRYAALATVIVLGGVLAATALMEEALGERAVAAVRGELRTELEVGGAAISLWRAFPRVRIGLRDVRLGGHPEGEFLTARQLSSELSWYDLLFAEDWTFSAVRVADARLVIRRDAERRGNWLVLEPRDSTGASAPAAISFALSEIHLDEVEIDYRDDATETAGHFRIDDGTLAGRFASTRYTLTGQLAGASDFLALGDMRYVEGVAAGAEFALDIDLAANRYTFGPSTVTLDDMPVDLAGSFLVDRAGTTYDLQLHTERGQLGALLRALPRQWVTPAIRSLSSSGAFTLDGTVVGRHDARTAPAVRFGGSLHNGALRVPALGREATDVSFKLTYTNGERPGMKGSQLVLANLNAQLDGQPLNGNFAWTDFADPFYDAEVSGTMPLAWLDALSPELDFGGRLTLRDCRLRGRHRYLVDPAQAKYVTTSGRFRLEGATVRHRGERYGLDAADIRLAGQTLHVDGGTVEGHGDALAVELAVDNLVPYALGDDAQVLGFSGSVTAPTVDLASWVAHFTEARASSNAEAGGGLAGGSEADVPFATKLVADIDLRADRLRYGDIDARRVTGRCRLKDSELEIAGEAHGMEGHWSVDASVALRSAMRLSAKLACSEVNVTELFAATDNLGQDVVDARHISGEMTTRALLEAAWRPDGSFDEDGLHVYANVGLTDGELEDFEMLQALSRFVRRDELRHIKFIDLENWIEVDGRQVYLPAMFVQTTATNFTIAGEHSFAHDIDYSVRVNGAQVAVQKIFGKQLGVDFVPDRRRGFIKTGVSIEGSLVGDNYVVEMAGKKVARQLRHSRRRKDDIRRRLTARFGPESLIDRYDDDGELRDASPSRDELAARTEAIAGAPPKRGGGGTFAGAIAGDAPPLIGGRKNPPAERPTIVVDTDTYIDFGDEGTGAEAGVSGAGETLGPTLSRERPAANEQPAASGEGRRPLFGRRLEPATVAPAGDIEVDDETYLDFGGPDGRRR